MAEELIGGICAILAVPFDCGTKARPDGLRVANGADGGGTEAGGAGRKARDLGGYATRGALSRPIRQLRLRSVPYRRRRFMMLC